MPPPVMSIKDQPVNHRMDVAEYHRTSSLNEQQVYAGELDDMCGKDLLDAERSFLNDFHQGHHGARKQQQQQHTTTPSFSPTTLGDVGHASEQRPFEGNLLDFDANLPPNPSHSMATQSVISTTFSNMDLSMRENQMPRHTRRVIELHDAEAHSGSPVTRKSRRGTRGGEARQKRTLPSPPPLVPDRGELPSDVSDYVPDYSAGLRGSEERGRIPGDSGDRARLQAMGADLEAARREFRAQAYSMVDADVRMREISAEMLKLRLVDQRGGV